MLLGAAPRPVELADAPQWWYACLYTGGVDATDDVVAGLLPPVLAEVRALGASRWFFLRYVDRSGPHLRLRVFGPGASLDRLVRSVDDLGAHLELITTAPRARRIELVPGAGAALLAGAGDAVGVRPAVYEPEIDKYGGLDGVELAERLFEFSSELALWGVSEHEKGGARDALAALLLADAAGALLHGARAERWPARRAVSWSRFWHIHSRWWTGAVLGDETLRVALEARAAGHRDAVGERLRRTAALPGVQAWRRRWFRAIDDHLAAAGRMEVPRSPQHLVFHQNHMLMNRLGYLPREEALLGIHARDWTALSSTDSRPSTKGQNR
jgi:thiopeptide-type bacteriocin biosynthesis protein